MFKWEEINEDEIIKSHRLIIPINNDYIVIRITNRYTGRADWFQLSLHSDTLDILDEKRKGKAENMKKYIEKKIISTAKNILKNAKS